MRTDLKVARATVAALDAALGLARARSALEEIQAETGRDRAAQAGPPEAFQQDLAIICALREVATEAGARPGLA